MQPDNKEPYIRLGNHMETRSGWEECYALYQKALELDPTDVRAHKGIGEAMFSLAQIREGYWTPENLQITANGYEEAFKRGFEGDTFFDTFLTHEVGFNNKLHALCIHTIYSRSIQTRTT